MNKGCCLVKGWGLVEIADKPKMMMFLDEILKGLS